MKTFAFAKRNLKEMLRDPISLVFNIGLPLLLFFVFKLITNSMSDEMIAITTPQFQVSRLTPAIAMFGYTFLTLFSGMLIAKDRTSSFLARIRTSPMKPYQFLLGYFLPVLLIAVIQTILVYCVGFMVGLEFSGKTFLGLLGIFPSSLLFIAFGLLFGSFVSDKAVGGLSSIVINAAAIFGGMFMPLGTPSMENFTNIAKCLPFANCLEIPYYLINGTCMAWNNVLWPILIVIGYTLLIIGLSLFVFSKKIFSDE